MDKLKKQLAGTLKHGFWIGVALITLGSAGVWFWTTSNLDSENASQVAKIKQNINKVSALRAELPTHPNAISHQVMEEMIKGRTDEVVKAWRQIFEKQTNILTWPKEIKKELIDELRYARDETTGKIDPNNPISKLPFENFHSPPATPGDESGEVAPRIRQAYRYYIGKVLPNIAAIADTEWVAVFDSAPASGGEYDGMNDTMSMTSRKRKVGIEGMELGPLVKWSAGNQESVMDDLFPWRGRRPSTLEVYYSQENLWLLKQLLEIVATVNGEAQQPFEAKIREIYQLGIGQSVTFDASTVATPGKVSMGGGAMDGMYGGSMDDMYEMESGGGAMGGMGAAVIGDAGDSRYVDTEMHPITAADLRTKLTSKNPEDAPIAVAKRVPVMMSVQIDQRYIPELVAACGSAKLMVEVKQMRIKPKGSASTASMGGGGMDSMDEMEDMGGGGGPGMGDPGMGGPGMETAVDEYPLDVQCEIKGLIYMYNPPDELALGVKKVTKDTVTEGALPAPNAATPAAGTPPAAGQPAPAAGTPPPAGQPAPAAGTPPATPPPAASPVAAGQPATAPAAINPIP